MERKWEIIPTFGTPRVATSSPHHHRHVFALTIATTDADNKQSGTKPDISNTPYVSISVGRKDGRISADAARETVSMERVNGKPNVSNLDLSKIFSGIYFLSHFNCLEIIYLNNASGICMLLRALRL